MSVLAAPGTARGAFHTLAITALDRLCDDAVAVTFGESPYTFRPGEHVTVRRTVDGVSGSVFVDAEGTPDRIQANTVSGDLTIRVDEGLGARYRINTVSGTLQLDGSVVKGTFGRGFTSTTGSLDSRKIRHLSSRPTAMASFLTSLSRTRASTSFSSTVKRCSAASSARTSLAIWWAISGPAPAWANVWARMPLENGVCRPPLTMVISRSSTAPPQRTDDP